MERRDLSGVLEEAVNRLEQDVRVLKNRQSVLTVNVDELETKRNSLSQEIMKLESEYETKKKKFSEDIEKMNTMALEKVNAASAKDAQAAIRLTELNEKLKDAENLIKANNSLKESLNQENIKRAKDRESMNEIIALIQSILNNL